MFQFRYASRSMTHIPLFVPRPHVFVFPWESSCSCCSREHYDTMIVRLYSSMISVFETALLTDVYIFVILINVVDTI